MAQRPFILWTLTAPPPQDGNGGLKFVHIPFIRIDLLTGAVVPERLAACRSAIVTSRWAVAALAPHRNTLARLPAIAIGDATRNQLLAAGGSEIATPAQATGRDLVKLLRGQPLPAPIFFPHGNVGGRQVLAYLEEAELAHYSPVVYHTIERPLDDIMAALPAGAPPVAVALGSPSAVGVWRALGPRLGADLPIASMGPATTRACREAGLEVWQEARSGDLQNLADQFRDRFSESLRPA